MELDFKIEGLIQEVERLEHFTDLAKTAQTPFKGFQLYPPEKCRHEIDKYIQGIVQIWKGEKISSFMPVCNFGLELSNYIIRIPNKLFQPKPSIFGRI